MIRRLLTRTVLATLALAGAAPAAHAAGLPALGYASGAQDVRSLNGAYRYETRMHKHSTTVMAIARSGSILSHDVTGRFTVPVVAQDGSPSGISADGSTLVLVAPRLRFPQAGMKMLVLDATTLRPLRAINLRGDFGFDAISPGGKWAYLIQYSSPTNQFKYRVRALDTGTGKLLSRDIVDPHEPGEQMHGDPITRLESPDGRWSYTLYNGTSTPFIHALDTANLTARCIDVPVFPANSNFYAARLKLHGDLLSIDLNGTTQARVSTRTMSLVVSAAAAAHVSSAIPRHGGGSGSSRTAAIVGVALMATVLLALAAAAFGRRMGPIARRILGTR